MVEKNRPFDSGVASAADTNSIQPVLRRIQEMMKGEKFIHELPSEEEMRERSKNSTFIKSREEERAYL